MAVKHFDKREKALMAALPKLIAHAKKNAPGFARILKDVRPDRINSRKALAALPVTRKSDLGALQKEMPPLGGLNATPVEKLAKLFLSPGPIYDPEGRGPNWWRTARGLFAGGFRAGDRVINTFGDPFRPAGSMLEPGLLALGCPAIPAGTGHAEIQAAAIHGLGAVGYVGTPSFLKLIVDKADELKVDISCLKRAQVGAEYLPPMLRNSMRERGITVTQMYGSADLGVIAYESLGPDGAPTEGMILDEGLLLEIVRPGTGDPLPPGEVGEVVITSFNKDYPLIRFGTGDLSAVLPGISACGRSNLRIHGCLARADQSTKVRAMFVTPSQVNEIVRRHAEVQRARLVVEGEGGNDRMTLICEVREHPAGLAEALVASIRDVTKLRGEVQLAAAGSLPNDGKVIEDRRKYG